MKNQKKVSGAVTSPLLQDLVNRTKSDFAKENPSLAQNIADVKQVPAALYQDDGGGYNADFVFPQE